MLLMIYMEMLMNNKLRELFIKDETPIYQCL